MVIANKLIKEKQPPRRYYYYDYFRCFHTIFSDDIVQKPLIAISLPFLLPVKIAAPGKEFQTNSVCVISQI